MGTRRIAFVEALPYLIRTWSRLFSTSRFGFSPSPAHDLLSERPRLLFFETARAYDFE